MNSSAIFLGIIPLLVFVIVDSFSTLKMALITAIIMAFIEAAFSLYYFGSLDWITIFSIALLLLLAFISYQKRTSIHFKMQPVLLSFIIGMSLLITSWLGNPLLYHFAVKYQHQLPYNMGILIYLPSVTELLKLSSHYLGYAMLIHSAMTAWAALRLSNWWWIAIRGVGFYLFSFMAMFIARMQVGI